MSTAEVRREEFRSLSAEERLEFCALASAFYDRAARVAREEGLFDDADLYATVAERARSGSPAFPGDFRGLRGLERVDGPARERWYMRTAGVDALRESFVDVFRKAGEFDKAVYFEELALVLERTGVMLEVGCFRGFNEVPPRDAKPASRLDIPKTVNDLIRRGIPELAPSDDDVGQYLGVAKKETDFDSVPASERHRRTCERCSATLVVSNPTVELEEKLKARGRVLRMHCRECAVVVAPPETIEFRAPPGTYDAVATMVLEERSKQRVAAGEKLN